MRTFSTESAYADEDINWVEQSLGDRTYFSVNDFKHYLANNDEYIFILEESETSSLV